MHKMQTGAMLRSPQAWPAPATLVVLFAAAQIVVWTLAPALTHRAPPLDVVEGYMWGREWVIATYKHPALPSWFLELSRVATGVTGWPAYLVSQLFIAATFGLVFLLGRDMMGPARAAAGTLLLAGVTYYTWPTPEFNHNVAVAPFWAGVALALWRAVERRSILWWMLLGAFAAGGLYAKLSAALMLAPAAAWIVFDSRARACLATPGPWLGLAVFAILVTPLAAWLIAHDFAPLAYAAQRSAARPMTHLPLFLLDTAANLAGMVVMLAIAGLVGPRRGTPGGDVPQQAASDVDAQAQRFLLYFTLGPLVLAVVAGLLSHAGLKTAWGSSMFNLAGLLAIALTAERYTPAALRRIAIGAAVFLVVVPIGYAAAVKIDAHRPFYGGMRVNWPQRAIADRLGSIWTSETGQPLRIVTGDAWIAGLVGLTNRDAPSIFTNADTVLSPWITRSRIEREGMLIVWQAKTGDVPPRLLPLLATSKTGEEKFDFSPRKGQRELVVGYAIVAPKQPSPRLGP